MRRYLIIAIACWLIAAWAATGWTENMFFHMDVSLLERSEPIIEMEEYDLCMEWSDAEEPECLEWMSPRPMRLKTTTPNTVYWEAYAINGVEIRNAVKVGVCNGKDIIHVVSSNMDLKKDPAYIGSSYKGMKDVSLFGQCMHDGVHETVYEAEELVEGEMKMVTKRIKTKAWKDKGSPPVKKSERIPHVYFGVDVE